MATTIKDGLGSSFSLLTKDVSTAQDNSLRRSMIYSTAYPVDYGAGGSFQTMVRSGIMAAGIASSSPIFSFQWSSSTLLALVKRIKFNAWSLGTGFTTGIAAFDLFVARNFTAADGGGTTATKTGNNFKLRTSMGTSTVGEIRYSQTATLTAGTRTLDAAPVDGWNIGVGAGTYTNFNTMPVSLFEKLQGEHPLLLAQDEGLVIQATVPTVGTWSFKVVTEWDEVPLW